MHTAVNLVDEIVNFILLQINEHWDEVKQLDAAIRFFAQIKNNLCAGSKIPVDRLLLVNFISTVGIYLERSISPPTVAAMLYALPFLALLSMLSSKSEDKFTSSFLILYRRTSEMPVLK